MNQLTFDDVPRARLSKNRRKVLAEWAIDLDSQGLQPDQLQRLISKARQESHGDPWALLATWLETGTWREKLDEILGAKVARMTAKIAASRRAR